MMKWLSIAILLVGLTACKAVAPSESISHNAINELQGVTQAVEHIQATTTPECRSDALNANLRAILTQVEGVSGQIKNIEMACKTEKKTLESEKQVRDIIIIALVVGIIGYILLRIKRWIV